MKTYPWLLFFSLFLLVAAPTSSLFSQDRSIGGNIFEDTDKDAQLDEGEGGAEAEVKLYRRGEDGRWVLVGTVETDAQGNYVFPPAPLGTYRTVITFKETPNRASYTVISPVFDLVTGDGVFTYNIPVVTPSTLALYSALIAIQPGANPSNTDGEEVSKFAP